MSGKRTRRKVREVSSERFDTNEGTQPPGPKRETARRILVDAVIRSRRKSIEIRMWQQERVMRRNPQHKTTAAASARRVDGRDSQTSRFSQRSTVAAYESAMTSGPNMNAATPLGIATRLRPGRQAGRALGVGKAGRPANGTERGPRELGVSYQRARTGALVGDARFSSRRGLRRGH